MELFFSHTSALEFLRNESLSIPLETRCSNKLVIHDFQNVRKDHLHLVAPTAASVQDVIASRYSYMSQPVHIMASSPNMRCKSPNIICHSCTKKLGSESAIRISSDQCASSPELCFVQMSQLLSLAKTIELGFELCGTYAKPNGDNIEIKARNPLTSPQRIMQFLQRTSLTGKENAKRAIKYVQAGSASPMETLLTLLLCLPKRHGGYGLPRPKLNYPIKTQRISFGEVHGGERICDLFWPDKKVSVEYDSVRYHENARSISRDAIRRVEVANADVAVVTVSKAQIFDVVKTDEVAALLFKLLGVRFQKPSAGWRMIQKSLRAELMNSNSRKNSEI